MYLNMYLLPGKSSLQDQPLKHVLEISCLNSEPNLKKIYLKPRQNSLELPVKECIFSKVA